MNFIIKKATLKDIDKGLLDIYIEGFKYHQKNRLDIFEDKSNETLKEELINDFNNKQILIILDNNKIVGYIAYKIKEKNGKRIYINQLIIKEEYRKKGLAKRLINEVKNIGLKNNCSRIELNCWMFNTNALNMYEHLGFNKQRIIYELELK